MTRQQIRSALDRVLGIGMPERIVRELNSSILRTRCDQANGHPPGGIRHLFRSVTPANVIGAVFRQLRTAAEKSGSRGR